MVWGYLRDSGGDAQEQSVPQQKAELTSYCQHYGLVITHIFADVAKSVASVVGRDAFLDMVDMSADVELRRNGLVIHSLTDPIPDGHLQAHCGNYH